MKLIKFILIPLLIFATQLAIFGQETLVGKQLAENFWKAISENREFGAKNALEALKRREPNFDVSKMEKALSDMQSSKGTDKEPAKGTSQDDVKSKIEADKILTKLFQRNLQTDSSDKEETTKKAITEYNQLTEKVITFNRSTIQKELDLALRYVKKVVESNDRNRNKLTAQINESLDTKTSEFKYYELLLRQSYLDNARQVFPYETDIKTAYEAISSDIKSLGSFADRNAKAEKNLNAKIDAEKMPAPNIKDAKLENWFKDMFVNYSAKQNKNYTFLRVIVVTNDYTIKRNEITGIVIGRTRGADIALKKADGKCFHGVYIISQEYVGGSFTNATISLDLGHKEIRCENVNK